MIVCVETLGRLLFKINTLLDVFSCCPTARLFEPHVLTWGALFPSRRLHLLLETPITLVVAIGWGSTSTCQDRNHRRYGATLDCVVGTHREKPGEGAHLCSARRRRPPCHKSHWQDRRSDLFGAAFSLWWLRKLYTKPLFGQ